MRIVITMPVYEDWDAALRLCQQIDDVAADCGSLDATVLLVDDGSNFSICPAHLSFQPRSLSQIVLLRLQRNLGHQRAIAVALAYLREHWSGDAVVVMDADGEDRPEDIPKLLNALNEGHGRTAVFAERGRRVEGLAFRLSYRCYSVLHRIIAGRDIRFGNFSVMPWSHLDTLVLCPEMWNHYAATFLKLRLPYVRVRCDRGRRLAGQSRMNFVSLLIHGISALFANQEVVGTRLLLMTFWASGLFVLLFGVMVGRSFFAHVTIPGWVALTGALLFIVIGQLLFGSFMLMFSVMMTRSHLGFLPIRDYTYFVAGEKTLYLHTAVSQTGTAAHSI